MNLIHELEQEQIAKLSTGKEIPDFGPGDTVLVAVKVVEGERTRFWIPQDLAYKGEAGSPRGMLVFDVDLIKIE